MPRGEEDWKALVFLRRSKISDVSHVESLRVSTHTKEMRWEAGAAMFQLKCLVGVSTLDPYTCSFMSDYATPWKIVLQAPLSKENVHGVFQAKILERFAISSSRGSSQPSDWTCIAGRCFTAEPPRKPTFDGKLYTHVALPTPLLQCNHLKQEAYI